MTRETIKTMKLYHQVERVFRELKALGIADDEPVDSQQLSQFDQYHYLGTAAVDEAVTRLGISSGMHVVEVGSGIGGPARHLAHQTGCRVTALELQPDLNAVATELTRRCKLSSRIEHRAADVMHGIDGTFDALVSWLTFLHIPDRPTLYAKCREAIRADGGMYVEDYFARGPLSDTEWRLLSEEVFCTHVPTLSEYERELEQAGFLDVQLIDMSGPWTQFVAEREAQFQAAKERNIAVHGTESVAGLESFYACVKQLFEGGNLGGLRIVARA